MYIDYVYIAGRFSAIEGLQYKGENGDLRENLSQTVSNTGTANIIVTN